MKIISFTLITLSIFVFQIDNADESPCIQFYNQLFILPHTKLILNSNGFVSLLDKKKIDGCEIIFESDESIVSGDIVYQKFQSFTKLQGWSIDENLIADGPGSSTIGIENDQNKCILHWSQHSWIDEKSNQIKQSEQIKLIVQCVKK